VEVGTPNAAIRGHWLALGTLSWLPGGGKGKRNPLGREGGFDSVVMSKWKHRALHITDFPSESLRATL
jgi:hypothetical protein